MLSIKNYGQCCINTTFTSSFLFRYVRSSLLHIAKVTQDEFTAIPLNGSGAFVSEATLRTMFYSAKMKVCVLASLSRIEKIISQVFRIQSSSTNRDVINAKTDIWAPRQGRTQHISNGGEVLKKFDLVLRSGSRKFWWGG